MRTCADVSVPAQHAEDSALDSNVGGGDEDGVHFGVGGLEPNHGSFPVIAFQGSF